jgi:hypothetical protein
MRLDTPNLITKFGQASEGVVLRDGSLRYIILSHDYRMQVIIRTREELFVDTLRREGAGMKVVVNGSYYDVSSSGLMDAALGHDPVPASETTILGLVVRNGRQIAGVPKPQHFYFANRVMPGVATPTYEASAGNPPIDGSILAAVGGLGPMIIGALSFGIGNVYRPLSSGPSVGDPGVSSLPNLIQRNNETFRSAESRPAATGKTIIASSSLFRKLIIAVQEHGFGTGQSYRYIASSLLTNGFEHAVFLDGSDSATLMVDGVFHITPGEDKSETNTLGIGFSLL